MRYSQISITRYRSKYRLKLLTIFLNKQIQSDLTATQSRSQSPRYPRPAVGNEGLWDKAFRIAFSLAEI